MASRSCVNGGQDPESSLAAFEENNVFSGVYVWVSVVTGRMYVGSTKDFKQRIYSHVRACEESTQTAFASLLAWFWLSHVHPCATDIMPSVSLASR